MKSIQLFTLVLILALPFTSFTQAKKVYNPEANAIADVKEAIEAASKEGKHVFLQVGGNWCPWCIKFHNFVDADLEIKSYLEQNFKVVKINYDKDNKQEELLANLGFPQRFGFPVFVVLDSKGNRIHTQNSGFLEKDKTYDHDSVLRFLKNWSPSAIDPASYKK